MASHRSEAPVLTLFIGEDLYYGGWVAPNIYALGQSDVVNVGGLRVGAIGGVYDAEKYQWGM